MCSYFKNTGFYLAVIHVMTIACSPIQAEIKPDFLMDSDPNIGEVPRVLSFIVDHAGVWTQALERPEADLQRLAAEAITGGVSKRIPHLDRTIPALEKIVSAQASKPVARFAAAQALVALDSKASAPTLFESSQRHEFEIRQIVEPALAKWDFASARRVWLARLDSVDTRKRDLLLAIRALGTVREATALPKLLEITMDLARPTDLRLNAATAAGQIMDHDLEHRAEQLSRSTKSHAVANRLGAICLLGRHQSQTALEFLIRLTNDTEPTVVGKSLDRLNEIDPDLVIPLAERAFQSQDATVRLNAVNALLRRPDPDRVRRLCEILDDPHPTLRRHICSELERLAHQQDLGAALCEAARTVLGRDSWRGQEQAALLLGQLEYLPATSRLVELLESNRPEVAVASAWSLRKIADPETLSGIGDYIQRRNLERKKLQKKIVWLDHQIAHLFELFGKLKVLDAKDRLIEYVPKRSYLEAERSRSAAIWSLGKLHEGNVDETLATALMERYKDQEATLGEFQRVKDQSIIAIARMKASKFAGELKQAASTNIYNLSLRWTVKQLSGEELPFPPAVQIGAGLSFLDPIDFIEPVLIPEESPENGTRKNRE